MDGLKRRGLWSGAVLRRAGSLTGALRVAVPVIAGLMMVGVSAAQTPSTDWVLNLDDGASDPTQAGGTVTYNIRVENVGATGAGTTSLTLTIPANTTFSGATGSITGCTPLPSAGPSTVTCTVPALASRGVATLAARLETSTSTPSTITFTASLPASVDPNDERSETTTITEGEADLNLDVTGPGTAQAGALLEYTFTIGNAGPDPARNISLTIPAPAGLANITVPPGCTRVMDEYRCTIAGPLAPGATTQIVLGGQGVDPDSAVTVQGTVRSGATDPNIDDPGSDNTDSTSTTLTDGVDLAITKTRAPSGVLLVGTPVTFTLRPTFTGALPPRVTVIDDVPAEYSVSSASGSGWTCTVVGQRVECTMDPAPGSGANQPLGTITINAVAQTAGSPTNSAVIDPGAPIDPVASNNNGNDGGVQILEPVVDLQAVKTGPASVVPGGTTRFEISTKNSDRTGNASVRYAGQVEMTDTLPEGMEVIGYVATNGWTCTPPSASPTSPATSVTCVRNYPSSAPLAVGATTPPVILLVRVAEDYPGGSAVMNRLDVTHLNPAYTETYAADNRIDVGVGVAPPADTANLSVRKTVSPSAVPAGDILTFNIEIVNAGPSEATDVTVSDAFTALTSSAIGTGFVSLNSTARSASGMTCSTTTLGQPGLSRLMTCHIDRLPVCMPGSTCPTITVEVRPGGGTSTRTNTAFAGSTVPDPDYGNNDGSVSYNVEPRANVTVSKTASPTIVDYDDTVTYTIIARTVNDRLSPAENVTITDTLPHHVRFVSATPATGSCGTTPAANSITATANDQLVCNLGTVGAGSSRAITVVVRPTVETAGQSIKNVVVVSTTTPGDDAGDNRAEADVTVRAPPLDLIFNKIDTVDPVLLGDTTDYVLEVQNSGPGAANNVVVTDTLPAAGLNYVSHRLEPDSGSCSLASGILECSFTRINPGSVNAQRIYITMRGDTKGAYTNEATVTSDETRSGRDPIRNNSADETTRVITRADMEVVSKTPSASPVALGEAFDFAILVRNNTGPGLTEADDVEVADTLPAGMELVSAPTAVVQSGSTSQNVCTGATGDTAFTCQFGTVSSGGSIIITAPVRVTRTSATLPSAFTNAANVFTTSFEDNTDNNSNTGSVDVNAGASLAGVVFRDLNNNGIQDPGDTGVEGATITLVGTPASGGSPVRVELTTAADGSFSSGLIPAGTFVLTRGPYSEAGFADARAIPGTGGGTPDGALIINGVIITQTAPAVGYNLTLAPASLLGLTKQMVRTEDIDGNGQISLNDILHYEVVATNTGAGTLTNVVVTDARLSPDTVTCVSLAPQQTCVIEGSLTVTLADVIAGNVVNTASADSTETPEQSVTFETPVLRASDGGGLTKTGLISSLKRGERAPFVIEAADVQLTPLRIIDIMPPGFAYASNSARVNGTAVEPVIDGRNLVFDALTPDSNGDIRIELTLIATSAAATGDTVNRAELVDPGTGEVLDTARARVTILEEAVFDCSDVIGKVFDDKNRNGYQDEGEPGLPGVRLATVKGLLVTTDPHGRFSIACADIPDQDIGSNFIVKLDQRTLPTGYRVTTENPRMVRLTRGKMVKLNFGAAIGRVVNLDLNAQVFEPQSAELRPRWQAGLGRLVAALAAEPSTLSITYVGEDGRLAKARIKAVRREIERRWKEAGGGYRLEIDSRITRTTGETGQ
jgi:uncharacterized repeat protein (TIGR01451 family)